MHIYIYIYIYIYIIYYQPSRKQAAMLVHKEFINNVVPATITEGIVEMMRAQLVGEF